MAAPGYRTQYSGTVNPAERTTAYLGHPDSWGTTPAATVVTEVAAAHDAGLQPGRAVDLGSGDGRHARWLATLGWSVAAVDVSAETIAAARDRDTDDGRDGHVEWICADARHWEPEADVELVVIGFVHMDRDELRTVIARAGTWLAPGGHLLYLGHAAENLRRGVGGPHDPQVLPDLSDLAQAATGLQVLSLRHELRPAGTATAIDAVLHARRWEEA